MMTLFKPLTDLEAFSSLVASYTCINNDEVFLLFSYLLSFTQSDFFDEFLASNFCLDRFKFFM